MDRGEFEAGPVQTQPSVVYKNKSNRGLVILLVIFVLATAGLGTVLGITLMSNKSEDKKEDKKTVANSSTATVDENGNVVDNDAKIRELIHEAEDMHTAALDGYSATRTFDGGVEISIGDGVIMSTNHSYGLDSYNMSDAYYKLVEARRSTLDSKMNTIFSKYGLSKTSEPKGHFSWGNEHYGFYGGNNIVCYYGTDYGFALECADKNWYSEDDKTLNLALADAYKKKTGEAIGYIDAKTSGITKNNAGTYERITAGLDDAVALFYRKNGGEWKYFVAVQQGPGCEAYNTSELKEAYAGEKCWDNSGNETVVK